MIGAGTMALKLIAFLTTFVVNIAAGAGIFFVMLVAMNGFHESDAAWGLGVYIILALLVAALMGSAAFLIVRLMLKKLYSGAVSALIAIPVFSILGIGLEVAASVIGIGVAELVRVNF